VALRQKRHYRLSDPYSFSVFAILAFAVAISYKEKSITSNFSLSLLFYSHSFTYLSVSSLQPSSRCQHVFPPRPRLPPHPRHRPNHRPRQRSPLRRRSGLSHHKHRPHYRRRQPRRLSRYQHHRLPPRRLHRHRIRWGPRRPNRPKLRQHRL